MSRFEVTSTPLAGLHAVRRARREDARGFLSRLFCARELAAVGWDRPVAQINHTLTRATGSVRGLHFQHPPHAESKLVSCLRGEVWDVAVDLRCGSPTFLRWHAQHLSADNACALLIPRGFAHGFQTLTPDCELIYLHDAFYDPASEDGVHPLDPRVAIEWPLAIGEMSERDCNRPMLRKSFEGIRA
jgi:dTDP-4-dehydrorhamnose 3,5-epimerase